MNGWDCCGMLHTVIGNVRAFIEGTYHRLGKKHLQFYLERILLSGCLLIVLVVLLG